MSFTEEQKLDAWNKARIIEGTDANLFRQDACGAWIRWDMYANRNNDYGWEIDHIFPESRGGTNISENLRALQWENNLTKGDDYPCYMAAVTSQGIENVPSNRFLMVNDEKRKQLKQYYPDA